MGTHAVAYRAWRIFFAVLPTRHRRWTTWQWERPARNAPAGAMPGVHSFLPWVVLFCPIMRGLCARHTVSACSSHPWMAVTWVWRGGASLIHEGSGLLRCQWSNDGWLAPCARILLLFDARVSWGPWRLQLAPQGRFAGLRF